MTSYVCKSSQSSLVKGFIPDNSTRLNCARAREGRRCSDKRLLELVKKALHALEDPAAGFVFDDFDLRYREREARRELKSAAWFYRNKLSFERKYAEDCGREPCNEPAWVSDGGRGAAAVRRGAGADLAEKRREKRRRAALAKARRVSPALAKTLGLIIKNGRNRKESIWTLAKTR